MQLEWIRTDTDPKSSSWTPVLERREFLEELDRLSRIEWHYGAVEGVRARPLRFHRNRGTFEVEMKSDGRWRSLIVKLHETDRSDIFQAMKDVVDAGFAPEAEFGSARPLAYLPSLKMLFEEKVWGTEGKELFLKGSPKDQMMVMERSAAWLARFHAKIPRLGQVLEPKGMLLTLEKELAEIRRLREPLANKCELLLRKVRRAMPDRASVYCAGHGSYMTNHVFLDHERTAIIDLDEHDTAEAARDLANFVISVERLALKQRKSLQAFDAAIEVFMQAYTSQVPGGSLDNLPFYKAALFLHKAQRDLYKPIPPLREQAEIMVDEGFITLQR